MDTHTRSYVFFEMLKSVGDKPEKLILNRKWGN